MYSNKLYTPLRYPGGKAPFAPFIAEVMAANGLGGGHYLEPYAGGAGVALELLIHGHASHVHINDLDPAIYFFWLSATKHSDQLIDMVARTPVTIDEWFKWRSVLRGETPADTVERGFATLFINRTNRSGILKAGVIGGLKQDGPYKLDARFKKDVIIDRLSRIKEFSRSISVYSLDALELLAKAKKFLPRRSLTYLDPPYYEKGQGLYRNYYQHQDHVDIAQLLQSSQFKHPWVVSYDNVSEIGAMYEGTRALQYGLNYTAQKRYVGNEVMFFSQQLCIPSNALADNKAAA